MWAPDALSAVRLSRIVGERNMQRAAWVFRRSKLHGRSVLAPQGAFRARGKLHGSGRELSILAVGPDGFAQQLAFVFLQEIAGIEKVGDAARIVRRRDLRAGGDDIVAYARRPWESREPGELQMALSVDARIPATEAPEAYVANNLAKTQRQAWKRRHELGVDFTVSSALEDLRVWYERLHVPLTNLRHRDHAHLPPLESYAARLDGMEILLARRGGEVVAGEVLEHDRWFKVLTCTATGACPEILADGRLYKNLTVAMDYRAFQRAHERGIPTFSFGFTSPRVDRGLFSYKRQWGASFVPYAWALSAFVHLAPRRACEVLAHVPVVTQEGPGTVVHLGATAADEAGVDDLWERIKLCTFPNAGRLVIHAHADHASRLEEAVRGPLPAGTPPFAFSVVRDTDRA